MSTPWFAYHYTTNGHASIDPGRVPIDRTLLSHANAHLQQMAEVTRDRPGWAQDLVQVARGVFLADKLSPRDRADDRWTRHMDLVVHVSEPDAWTDPALASLSRLAETLTADRWTIQVRPGAALWPHQDSIPVPGHIEEVALFSGGLDSTAYAAERAWFPGGDLLLVSYHEPQWAGQQARARTAIDALQARSIRQFRASQQVVARRPDLEPSARSRGLLYMATAVYLAAAHGISEVAVPENGQLALNPALTPARVAACSTRSVHPHTLALLNELIEALGGSVTVVNPYLHLTKGEVCRRAVTAGLRPSTLTGATLSCGRPPRDRPELHCGHCFPCLVRHSGLLAALDGDETPYGKDVWTIDDGADAAADRRALHRWLSRPFGVRDLVTDMPLPTQLDLAPLLDVVERGRAELAAMFIRHRQEVTNRTGDRPCSGMGRHSGGKEEE